MRLPATCSVRPKFPRYIRRGDWDGPVWNADVQSESGQRVLREVNHFGNGIVSVVEFGGIAGYDQSGSDFARFFPWARRPGSPLRERVGSTFSLNAPTRPGRGARRNR